MLHLSTLFTTAICNKTRTQCLLFVLGVTKHAGTRFNNTYRRQRRKVLDQRRPELALVHRDDGALDGGRVLDHPDVADGAGDEGGCDQRQQTVFGAPFAGNDDFCEKKGALVSNGAIWW